MEINECINYLLTISQNKVFQYFSDELKQFKLTPSQYGVLKCIWENSPQTPKQIGKVLFLEASSISGVLDRMQKNGLIIREIDNNNRRNILIYPTEKALELREEVEKIVNKLNKHFLDKLSEEERKKFRTFLLNIANQEN
ncbi:Organic hydroperoxide resistance transcriptional regulator [Fusobacterium necrogenes]|uniref:Organic hydroperoxide resistance transcriptional regulator n=1 Tax=Fusobacterium necrogenes TaxID=858 RepID=A0A377GVV5_9FUSO|nr:MarR family transcriptional regulator [Fusobacterium necrogenes]STO31076.1 Organic hydroperoxide resistance transcriptional regulator [Fusobacterium necrogenes]